MRLPQPPPSLDTLLARVARRPDRLQTLVQTTSDLGAFEPYYHWDDLRHRPPC